jgi:hypothetical protein
VFGLRGTGLGCGQWESKMAKVVRVGSKMATRVPSTGLKMAKMANLMEMGDTSDTLDTLDS